MNTSHDDLRRLVDWHFGKGLSLTNEARLRNHLPACADCREAYEVYQAAERLDAKALGLKRYAAILMPSEETLALADDTFALKLEAKGTALVLLTKD